MKSIYLKLFKKAAWLFMILSLGYLFYTIYTHQSLPAFIQQITRIPASNTLWLIPVIILLPLNLYLESLKWQFTLTHTQAISIRESFRSVLAGMASGFMTPNRIGDIFGRILYLKKENYKAGVTLSTITSLTKNLAILIPGIPAAIYFFLSTNTQIPVSSDKLILTYLLSFILITGALLLMPYFTGRITNPGIMQYIRGIRNFSTGELFKITLISVCRVAVFSFQLWLMLRYFGAEPGIIASLTAIPASWLFITFTPSLALTEGIVRSSWVMFFIGHYNNYHPGVMLAGFTLWLINVVIPVMAGSYFFIRGKKGI
jgi:hypothetical protein